eukprot:GHVT01045284.1.p1 GENE.GHVT01045284.1~~GHVT01045284.1.p1  ORF type:complete len:141 (+),score=25.87 GHVT01045284.1:274-696(+)
MASVASACRRLAARLPPSQRLLRVGSSASLAPVGYSPAAARTGGPAAAGGGGGTRMAHSRLSQPHSVSPLLRLMHTSALRLGKVQFKLADIGEGIAEVELLKWHKKEGDQIEEVRLELFKGALVLGPTPTHCGLVGPARH